ncbi:MAG: hypothetical protein LBQ95_06520 [Lachnospiraceae bacterium]|jgi:cell division septum initiation protein DivIVA|nr:hypothetical protein [Lachnospiraceae bacterium]
MNNELKRIPAIKDIARYLREMNFKKKLFGGCDEENVLDHIEIVTEKYTEIIETLIKQNVNKDKEIKTLMEKTKQAQERVNYLTEWQESAMHYIHANVKSY